MRDAPADTQLFAQLTDKQKEVLRLIAAGLQQKEAAAQLGITVQALVERLRPVRRMFHESGSKAIAARLISWERAQTYTSQPAPYIWHVGGSETLESSQSPSPSEVAAETVVEVENEAEPPVRLHEAHTPYRVHAPHEEPRLTSLLFPTLERLPNTLDARTRLRVIAIEALVAAVVLIAAMWSLIAFSHWLRDISIHGG